MEEMLMGTSWEGFGVSFKTLFENRSYFFQLITERS